MPLHRALTNSFVRRLSIVSLSAMALTYGAVRLVNASESTPSAAAFPDPATDVSMVANSEEQTAVFAGGCFWGMEGVFEHLRGVSEVVTGYSGGSSESAHYEAVSAGATDHAEGIKITYDPSQISYGQLLKVFFAVAHDPTQLNRQGPDVGPQYRSAIFFTNDEQKQVAESYISQLDEAQLFDEPIVTELAPLDEFYAAEDYHQDFIARNPYNMYVVVHDLPQIERLKEEFPELYQE
ncbi:MAG: peptide-methionine (S)-S-oxide reductase MsrA [Cyanophyceae cyanobacterium]